LNYTRTAGLYPDLHLRLYQTILGVSSKHSPRALCPLLNTVKSTARMSSYFQQLNQLGTKPCNIAVFCTEIRNELTSPRFNQARLSNVFMHSVGRLSYLLPISRYFAMLIKIFDNQSIVGDGCWMQVVAN